MEMKGGCISGG